MLMNLKCSVLILSLITLSSCRPGRVSQVDWETGQPSDAITTAILERDASSNGGNEAELVYVAYQRIAGTSDWYIARTDWQNSWWGTFEVFQWADGRIAAAATAISPQMEIYGQSVDKIGSLLLNDQPDPIVYIIDTTHQGNRTLMFWRLDAHQATLHALCRARITLNFGDAEYDLDWKLQDANGDGHSDLVMTGELRESTPQPDGSDGPPQRKDVRKVFLYDCVAGQFLLSREHSCGVRYWDDFDSGYIPSGEE